MKLIIRILTLAGIVGSLLWYLKIGGYEPFVTFTLALAGFLGSLVVGREKRTESGELPKEPPLTILKGPDVTSYRTGDIGHALEKLETIRKAAGKPKNDWARRIYKGLNPTAERFLETLYILDTPLAIPSGLVGREAALTAHQVLASVDLLEKHELIQRVPESLEGGSPGVKLVRKGREYLSETKRLV